MKGGGEGTRVNVGKRFTFSQLDSNVVPPLFPPAHTKRTKDIPTLVRIYTSKTVGPATRTPITLQKQTIELG